MASRTAIVREVVQDVLGIKLSSDSTDLIDTGLLDSLGLVDLVLALENAFGLELPFAALDIDDFRTVLSLAELVDRSHAVA